MSSSVMMSWVYSDGCCVSSVVESGLFLESGVCLCIVNVCSGCDR